MLARSREGGGLPLPLLLLVLLLLEGSLGMQQASYEQQRYDGWYNNLAHPAWGTVDSHLVRKTPPSYADGVYMMSGGDRPSPRNLSQAFMRGLDGLPSLKNRTAMQTFFGQVRATNPFLNLVLHSILCIWSWKSRTTQKSVSQLVWIRSYTYCAMLRNLDSLSNVCQMLTHTSSLVPSLTCYIEKEEKWSFQKVCF